MKIIYRGTDHSVFFSEAEHRRHEYRCSRENFCGADKHVFLRDYHGKYSERSGRRYKQSRELYQNNGEYRRANHRCGEKFRRNAQRISQRRPRRRR